MKQKYEVRLNMFKPTGKWHSEGAYESDKQSLWEIWREVREMRDVKKKLPGLVLGACDYNVHVEVPGHPHEHPHLIMLGQQFLEPLPEKTDGDEAVSEADGPLTKPCVGCCNPIPVDENEDLCDSCVPL